VLHRRRADSGETGERQGVARHCAHRSQDVGHNAVEPVHQRPDQVAVGGGIAPEVGRRLADIAVQDGGTSAAERMGEGHLGLAQHDPDPGQVE